MKLLEMGKDMKIKHNASSPPPTKYGGTFLVKRFCLGEHFWENLWGMFYKGTNDQMTQPGVGGGGEAVNGQEVSKVGSS